MNALLAEVFRYVCGQGDCPEIDGLALAVCWRCLGLYAGAALTVLWLVSCGLWRRGLPSWSVFVAQAAVLIAALLGGLHFISGPAAWKLTCGLWTGHVAIMWLVGGAQHLMLMEKWGQSQTAGQSPFFQLPWRTRDKAAALVALATLPAMAVAFTHADLSTFFLYALDALVVAGAAAFMICGAIAVIALAVAAIRASATRRVARASRP